MMAVWTEMIEIIKNFYSGNHYLILYGISLIYLAIVNREKRRTLVYPSIFLMVVIVNPWLYQYVYQHVMSYAYRRLLWVIPVVPVIAAAATDLLKRIPKVWGKWMTGILLAAVLFCTGADLADAIPNRFRAASNLYKIPQEAIDIADALLVYSPFPRVVMDDNLYCYVRQYTSKIQMMYGRDTEGFIAPPDYNEKEVSAEMRKEHPDYLVVSTRMFELNYDYLVVEPGQTPETGDFSDYGFEFVTHLDGYDIYYLNTDGFQTYTILNRESGGVSGEADMSVTSVSSDQSDAVTKSSSDTENYRYVAEDDIGWIEDGDYWRYRFADGSDAVNVWLNIGNSWRHFDADGYMQTNTWIDQTYYVCDTGSMVRDTWIDQHYYVDAAGEKVCDRWVDDCYLNADGIMVTNSWVGEYYVGVNGVWIEDQEPSREGWSMEADGRKYQDSDGTFVTDEWRKIDGIWYHFNESGDLEADTWIDHLYYVNEDGAFEPLLGIYYWMNNPEATILALRSTPSTGYKAMRRGDGTRKQKWGWERIAGSIQTVTIEETLYLADTEGMFDGIFGLDESVLDQIEIIT